MNGMSSETMSIAVCGDCQPCCSKSGCRRAPRSPAVAPAPWSVRHRGAVQVVPMPSREVAAGHMPVVLDDERLEQALLLRGQSLLGVPADLVDHLGPVAGRGVGIATPFGATQRAPFGVRRQGRWGHRLGIRASVSRAGPVPVIQHPEQRPSGSAQPRRRFLGTLTPVAQSVTAGDLSPSDRPFGDVRRWPADRSTSTVGMPSSWRHSIPKPTREDFPGSERTD